MTKSELAAALKAVREERDLTQENVADLVGVRVFMVSKWERPGHPSMPNHANRKKLVQVFGEPFRPLLETQAA